MVVKRLIVFVAVMAALVGVGRVALANQLPSGTGWTSGIGARGGTSLTGVASVYNPAVPHDAPIPQEALRLRIIANSDSNADQSTKRAVRDAVVFQVAKLLQGVTTSTQARAVVIHNMPQLQQIALNVVHQRGYNYTVKANVGMVPFPTKLYGNQVYPAGNYEALRIVLGQGQGQNWWCVLFPPLCFVDIADGDAVPNTAGFPDLPPLETIQVPSVTGGTTQVAVRVAALDYGQELWRTAKTWLK